MIFTVLRALFLFVVAPFTALSSLYSMVLPVLCFCTTSYSDIGSMQKILSLGFFGVFVVWVLLGLKTWRYLLLRGNLVGLEKLNSTNESTRRGLIDLVKLSLTRWRLRKVSKKALDPHMPPVLADIVIEYLCVDDDSHNAKDQESEASPDELMKRLTSWL